MKKAPAKAVLKEIEMPAMRAAAFDRKQHVYRNDVFVELIKDAVRFFNGTPVYSLPPPERFQGRGVYATYYTGKHPLYAPIAQANRLTYAQPIYIGKAVPKGWRQSRTSDSTTSSAHELFNRLKEHAGSLKSGEGLQPEDFSCRFIIFEDAGSDMIGSIEAALIKLNRPLWNSVVDGFGNHDPGSGRYQQARSDWDVLHPGRKWAEKCVGQSATAKAIQQRVLAYFTALAKAP